MPAYLFFGEDRFTLKQQVQQLRRKVIDENWRAFNDQCFAPDQLYACLNESVTPPFGAGGKVIILEDTPIFQAREKEEEEATNKQKNKQKKEIDPIAQELERTLPEIPETNHLVFIVNKASRRQKTTLLVEKYGVLQEFANIPFWKEDDLIRRIQTVARQQQVTLTPEAVQYLVEALGNDTARLHTEMTKLALATQPIGLPEVQLLVVSTAHTTFQISEALLQGKTSRALAILGELLRQNEPPLKISAVMTSQFRTWVWIRLLVEQGLEDPAKIAEAVGGLNPKRVYILKKQVQNIRSSLLLAALPLLLNLETGLKQGGKGDQLLTQTLVELGSLFAGR